MNAGLAAQQLLSISEWVTKLSHHELRELLAVAATRHQDVFWAIANEFRRTEAARIEGQNKVLARVWSTCYYDQPSQGFAQLAPEQVRAAEQAAGEQEEEDDDDDDEEEVLDFSQYPTKLKHLLVEKWKHLSLYALLHKHDASTEMIMDIFDTIVDQVSNDESSYGTKANALLTLIEIATTILNSPRRLALEVRKNLLGPRFCEKTGDVLERFYLDEAKTFFRTRENMKVPEDFVKIPRKKEFGVPVMPGMESIMSILERWSGCDTDDES